MIAIIDYGAGNLRSITRALEAHGANARVTSNLDDIRSAERIVLPGVGHARAAMDRLHADGLAEVITDTVQQGTPLLGVCLGMQLLFGAQEEGPSFGLNLIEGSGHRLTGHHKIPHMGWNTVTFQPGSPLAEEEPASFYFVHSYFVRPADPRAIAGTTVYGEEFASMVAYNHIWGTQFHPEKSGDAGLHLLKSWLDWSP